MTVVHLPFNAYKWNISTWLNDNIGEAIGYRDTCDGGMFGVGWNFYLKEIVSADEEKWAVEFQNDDDATLFRLVYGSN